MIDSLAAWMNIEKTRSVNLATRDLGVLKGMIFNDLESRSLKRYYLQRLGIWNSSKQTQSMRKSLEKVFLERKKIIFSHKLLA